MKTPKKSKSGAIVRLPAGASAQPKRGRGRPKKEVIKIIKPKPKPPAPVKPKRERTINYDKKSIEVERLIKISGLTIKLFSQTVSVQQGKVYEYLRGHHEIKVNTLKSWCKILGVDICDLFKEEV